MDFGCAVGTGADGAAAGVIEGKDRVAGVEAAGDADGNEASIGFREGAAALCGVG